MVPKVCLHVEINVVMVPVIYVSGTAENMEDQWCCLKYNY